MIAFGIGITLYFALPSEPSNVMLGLVFLGCLLGVRVCLKRWGFGFMAAFIVFFGVLGLGRATWHTKSAAAPKLPSYERVYEVEGRIKALEKSGPRLRWLVEVSGMDRLSEGSVPERIRVTTYDRSFEVGDAVRFRAQLRAPPQPVIPGGYNPAFRAYYEQVGAYGFMLSKPEAITLPPLSFKQRWSFAVAKIRYGMADRIRSAAPEETAGLQVALLTGIRTWVPDHQTEALRVAGLAHILAISGLHMGLIAGGVYSVALFFLVRIEVLARRQDVRKYAAMIGLVAATLYLILSGMSVATQRAFIMASIVFSALIMDRQAISVRSVAVAAFITLWIHPEALLSPGFQMSFSAVLALVVVYRAWDARRVYRGRPRWYGRIWENFKALSVTSLVAGTATSGFAVLHFNRIATYGFFANLLAMPFFTFWVMPVALLVYLAMPFGLEALPLRLMSHGILIILAISHWVETWPGAIKFMASGPPWVMAVFSLAFIALCLGKKRTRIASTLIMAASFAVLISRAEPDIRISKDGAVAFWSLSGDPVLYVDRKNSDRYGRQEFIEALGIGTAMVRSFEDEIGQCDSLACRIEFKDRVILIVLDPSELAEDCGNADWVIAPKRTLGARMQRLCEAPIIDANDLQKLGAHTVYLGRNLIKTAHPKRPRRPWHKGWSRNFQRD